MQITCIDNSGFEDQLTEGQSYPILSIQGNSVQLQDDRGTLRWYGRLKFRISDLLCRTSTPRQAA